MCFLIRKPEGSKTALFNHWEYYVIGRVVSNGNAHRFSISKCVGFAHIDTESFVMTVKQDLDNRIKPIWLNTFSVLYWLRNSDNSIFVLYPSDWFATHDLTTSTGDRATNRVCKLVIFGIGYI